MNGRRRGPGAGFAAGFTGVTGAVTAASHPPLLSRVSPSYRSLGELAFNISWALFRGTFSGRGKASQAALGVQVYELDGGAELPVAN